MGIRQEPLGEQPGYVFGAFRLMRQARQLYLGPTPVRLGGRALDLLLALVERAGEVVSHAELERMIWPGSVVEDSCLRVHIGALRKALGDGPGASRYIANVPGRGYSFVAPVVMLGADAGADAAPAAGARPLPLPMIGMLGRDEVLDQLRALLPRCRLVTIVGHGGIGKTTLALCLAAELRHGYADGACFVDLALLDSAVQIPDALAASLGLEPEGEGVRALLERWLAPRRMLLVLDNCEHLIEAATGFAECLLRLAPGIDVVATSREPLDADGEWVLRLGPLACPPDDPGLSLEQAMGYPALQLLASRAQAGMDTFRLGQAELPAAVELCRRVDGVPLAIEFAAAQVGLLGLHGVVEQLGDRLRLLASGRRTVLPRHRTLRALLDWSHELLSPDEQRVLRHCAVFVGPFSLEAALAVVGPGTAGCTLGCTVSCLLGLVSKSLVVADTAGPDARFVLLGITRAYAIERLAGDPGRHPLAARHALHTLGLLEECERAWDTLDHDAWLACASHVVGNLRAALDWAFGPGGERALGVRLVAAPAVLGADLLGERELERRVRAALEAIGAGTAADPLDEARLHAAIFRGPVVDWEPYLRAIRGAEAGGQPEALAEALHVCAVRCLGAGLYRSAHEHALRMARVAAQGGLARTLDVARRLPVASLHMLGEHDEALRLARQRPAAADARAPLRLAWPVGAEVARGVLAARTHWLVGQGRAAAALARELLALAARDSAPASLAWALALGALPVALWRGDDDWARDLAGLLEEHAERHGLDYWSDWARLGRQVLVTRSSRLETLPGAAWGLDAVQGDHLATWLGARAGVGLDAAAQRCAQGQVGWCAAEVFRAGGERLLLGPGAERSAEDLFERGLAAARAQGALAWELRCATSLGRLWRDAGDAARARALLQPLVLALADGHDGVDRRAALLLLQDL